MTLQTAFDTLRLHGAADPSAQFKPFRFDELRSLGHRLLIVFSLVAVLAAVVRYWWELLVILSMSHVFRVSEECLGQAAQFLLDRTPIPLSLQSQMGIYGFGNLVCAYFCLHVLIANLPSYGSVTGAVVASCLASLFVFLVFGAIKHIAFDFRFVRVYDIENGALSLFAMLSIIIRFVLVTPIWLALLGDCPLTRLPPRPTALCWLYLAVKCGGFLLLCWDYAEMCEGFFKSVLLRAPPGARCQRCANGAPARVTTQCGHSFCMACIDRRRQVEGACPVCRRRIPRKWVLPLKDGTISWYVMMCML
jgi:hypothetical protein